MIKAMSLAMALSVGLLFAPSVHASPILFSYTTSDLGTGLLGNSIVETTSGETVTATALSITGNSDTTFQTAALGQYFGLGLGVCNQDELPDCGAPKHEVDDDGQFDFVLFTFSAPVTSVTITIDPVCNCQSDASYYAGDNFSPLGETLADFGSATTSDGGDVIRSITLTGLGGGVNSVLFGASIFGDDNYFKIQSLSVVEDPASTPEPATFGLASVALIGLGAMRLKLRNARTR